MTVDEFGRRFYQTSELSDGTYEVRGERNPELTEFICKVGIYIRKDKLAELAIISYFRKIFTGCNWNEVYPLTHEELARHIQDFLKEEGICIL